MFQSRFEHHQYIEILGYQKKRNIYIELKQRSLVKKASYGAITFFFVRNNSYQWFCLLIFIIYSELHLRGFASQNMW